MSLKLVIESLILIVILTITILIILKKGRISVKYSLVWIFSILIILIATLIPNFMQIIANFLGFQTMSNMIFCLLILLLLFICMSLTIIVSGQKEKIKLLIQEVSMLKERIESDESRK